MNILLRKWTLSDKDSLKALCNAVDRQYLSDRLPSPYTDSDAEWWLNMVTEAEGKTGLFRMYRKYLTGFHLRRSCLYQA